MVPDAGGACGRGTATVNFVVREQLDGQHFAVVGPGGEVMGICTNRRAADDLADAMQRGCEEAIEAAVAYTKLRHGRAVVEPR